MTKLLPCAFVVVFFSIFSCGRPLNQEPSRSYSLTGESFTGKKFYLGWGLANNEDPSNMKNEVKYDVLHTHDILTAPQGGNYLGTKLIGNKEVSRQKIVDAWQNIQSQMTEGDMYLQYSSGHGFPDSIGVGFSWDEFAKQILSFPSREVVVFTMSCYSGSLINKINSRASEWQDRGLAGRSLLVFASSTAYEESSLGPGTDPDENGPYGSAGSAFGHALWKSIRGYADGYASGFKDGYISNRELIAYAYDRTREIGGHSPQFTGVFHPESIMTRSINSTSWLQDFSSENLSDEEVRRQVLENDRNLVAASGLNSHEKMLPEAPVPAPTNVAPFQGTTVASVRLQDLNLTLPEGAQMVQDANDEGKLILGISKGEEFVTLQVSRVEPFDLKTHLAEGASVIAKEKEETFGATPWITAELKKTISSSSNKYKGTYKTLVARTEKNGFLYIAHTVKVDKTNGSNLLVAVLSSGTWN